MVRRVLSFCVWLTILGRMWVVQAIFGEEWRSKGAGSATFVRLEGVVIPHHFFDACEMTWWCQKWITPTASHSFPTYELWRGPSPGVVPALTERERASKRRMRSWPDYRLGLSSHVVLMGRVTDAPGRSAIYWDQRKGWQAAVSEAHDGRHTYLL